MCTVALVGADGAGKTTVSQKIHGVLPIPVKYIYMGTSPEASNIALPTLRIISAIKRALGRGPDMTGPPDPTRIYHPPKGLVARIFRGLKSSLRLGTRLSEEWFRQCAAWYFQRRGYLVIFDRHFFSDFYAYDIASNRQPRPLTSRIHGYILNRFYPKPDLVIFLDAPAEVLLARKGEGTIELLNYRRKEYLSLQQVVDSFAIVDASQPQDQVIQQVAKRISDFLKSRRS